MPKAWRKAEGAPSRAENTKARDARLRQARVIKILDKAAVNYCACEGNGPTCGSCRLIADLRKLPGFG